LNYEIRPIDYDRDVVELAAMLDKVMTNGMTVENIRTWRNSPSPLNRHMIATDAYGSIVGWYALSRSENEPENRAFVSIIVHPDQRREGIGSALLEDAVVSGRSTGIKELRSRIKDDEPGWLEWAKSKGFEIDRHSFRSSIKLSEFDFSLFESHIAELRTEGIVFTTLAELGDTEESRRLYYEVDCAAAIDVPGEDHVASWDEYNNHTFKSEEYRPEGAFLAMDGDRMVAVANVWMDVEHDRMENAFTGVDPDYRGRGIAQSLKALTIVHAQQTGVSEILTENDSENAQILAVNRKLGYKPWPGVYRLTTMIG